MKDLLIIAHRIPYPPDKGDKIRTYHFLRYLSARYRVTVACIIDDPVDGEYVSALQQMVHQVFFEFRPAREVKKRAISALLTGRSVTQCCFYSKKLQRQIDDYLTEFDPEVILCFCSSTADYLLRSRHSLHTLQRRLLLNDLIDVDSAKWSLYAEKHRLFMRWLYQREARLLADMERRVVNAFHHVFLVSEEEIKVLAQHAPVANAVALSNGVDLEYFAPRQAAGLNETSQPKLVFSGAMDYWPNIEGAVWFAEKIFPEIRKAFPNAVLCIAGRNPSEAVLDLENQPGVEVTGTVPDMRDHLESATICVVPLKIARGIQNKVLEGMAMQKPVVATSEACTGLKVIDGCEIVVSDSDSELAAAVVDLLTDPRKQQDIGIRARQYVEREHSWDSHLQRLVDLIENDQVRQARAR